MVASIVNPFGASGEKARGSWCSPKWIADPLGVFDYDPCSNDRSHIKARVRYYGGLPVYEGGRWRTDCGLTLAKHVPSHARTFVNPEYDSVLAWVLAYRHTDFTFLLRWDPSVQSWFPPLIAASRYVWFPLGKRCDFEPPPGVKHSSNPIPHALYLRNPPPCEILSLGMTFAVDSGRVRG